jgi:metallophosphoesterase superfamily enzyme
MEVVAPQIYDTLILSDLHLGAAMSRAREALCVLQENQYRRLILLGDIFADLNFGRLKKEHWKFLGFIRKLSNPKRNVEVVWVEGNHDHGLAEIMSHLVVSACTRNINGNTMACATPPCMVTSSTASW